MRTAAGRRGAVSWEVTMPAMPHIERAASTRRQDASAQESWPTGNAYGSSDGGKRTPGKNRETENYANEKPEIGIDDVILVSGQSAERIRKQNHECEPGDG